MIKVEVIEEFNLRDFNKLEDIVRKDENKNKEGTLYVGDTFECDEEMSVYLLGKNPIKKVVVKVITDEDEVVDIIDNNEKNEEIPEDNSGIEEKPVKNTKNDRYKKRTSKK